jgi:hypothetical protein
MGSRFPLQAQTPTPADPTAYFLNAGVFFSPAMKTGYFNPALDLEAGFWKTNRKNFFSWGASAEVWEFASVEFDGSSQVIKNNTDGFINLNAMLFLQNDIITPYVAPSVSFASDFTNSGFSGGLALGLNHQTSDRLQTFVQVKYVRFTPKLDYLDMRFYMVGLALKLAKSAK